MEIPFEEFIISKFDGKKYKVLYWVNQYYHGGYTKHPIVLNNQGIKIAVMTWSYAD